MAKPAPQPQGESSNDVSRAIQMLRAYYHMGDKSLAESPLRVSYGSSSELLRKARSVARAFDVSDLDELAQLCRTEGTALGRSHLDRLATIPDRRTRMSWAKRAIRQAWSRITLDRQIRKTFGTRKNVGRKSLKITDAADAVSELIRLSVKLIRLVESLGIDPTINNVGQGTVTKLVVLPPEVVKSARTLLKAAKDMKRVGDLELGRIE